MAVDKHVFFKDVAKRLKDAETARKAKEEEAKKAQEGARVLFSGGADTAHMPSTELTEEDFTEDDTIDLITSRSCSDTF